MSATFRDQFRITREREYRQLSSAIDMLKRRAQIMGQLSSAEVQQSIEQLSMKRDELREKLESLAQAAAGQWEGLGREIDEDIADLEATMRAVVASLSR